jgi:flagellar hook capping protein FlgD
MKATAVRFIRTISVLVIALGLSAARGSADWAPNGNRIDPDPVNSSPRIVADPFAGLLVVFRPFQSKLTRVLPSGEVAAGWPVTAAQGYTSSPAQDGIAGMYVATAIPGHVVVHRFLEDGTPHPAWPADGIEICNAPGYKYADAGPDGAGGVYVVWGDGRNTDPNTGGFPHELYGTRVLADGSIAPGWQAQGTLLAAAPDSVVILLATPRPDGAGGMFEFIQHAYHYLESGEQRVEDRLLHVAADGTTPPGWPYGGWTAPPQALGGGFDFEPDGAGGTYVAWLQQQGGTYVSPLLRLLSSGEPAPGWPAEGIPGIDDPTHFQFIPSVPSGKPMAADGAGGVFVDVVIDTSGGFQFQVNRVVHFEGDGTRAADWPAQGRRLPLPPNLSPVPDLSYLDPVLLASDARGGIFAAWGQTTPDQTGNAAVIGAIHLDHAGNPTMGWPQGGRPVCDTPGQRNSIRIASDGIGGTYIVWSDRRPPDSGSSFVYASRLDAFDVVTVAPDGQVSSPLRVTPNPFSGSVDLAVTLAKAGDVRLDVFDVSGRAIRRVAHGWFPAGAHALTWDGRSRDRGEAPPGLYFVRGSISGQAVGARLVRLQ